jgi:cell division inhibitor SepF
MSFMDKMKNVIGLGEDDYDEDDILTDDYDRDEEPKASYGRKNKVVNIHATTQLKVVVMQPENFEDAKGIADHLKTKKPVIINLEDLETDVARRVVDFLSGAVYALTGKMQKVANGIILLVPSTMGIAGDFTDDFSDELKTHALFDFF